MRYLFVLLLAGCATQQEYVWNKQGASDQEFYVDRGQCNAQAMSVPGALMNNMTMMQSMMVFTSCMQGKGWQSVPK